MDRCIVRWCDGCSARAVGEGYVVDRLGKAVRCELWRNVEEEV